MTNRDVQLDAQLPRSTAGWRRVAALGGGVLLCTALTVTAAASAAAEPSEERPLAGPRPLLELMGIDQSQWAIFFDERPWTSREEETLVRLLFRLPQLPAADVHAWLDDEPRWAEFLERPSERRGELVRLRGEARRFEEVTLAPEVAELVGFQRYYRVEFADDRAPLPVELLVRRVPLAWTRAWPGPQRASAAGMFLKVAGEEPAGGPPARRLVLAATRIAWHPAAVDPQLGLDAGHRLLGQLGFDVGLLDLARATNRRPIGAADRDAFFQLLAAVRRADPAALRSTAAPFALGELLSEPPADGTARRASLAGLAPPGWHHGRVVQVEGTASRTTRIEVTDRDVVDRFGIDHYYQIDLFVAFPYDEVRIGRGPDDSQALTFTHSYPVTLCVARLPPGLSEGSRQRLALRLDGVYYKTWAYRTPYSSAHGDRRQLSPLLVGVAPEIIPEPSPPAAWRGLLGGGAFVLLLAAVAAWIWHYQRRDQQFARRLRR